MEKINESEMSTRMKYRIDELSHEEFAELYFTWFPPKEDINWDVSGPE